MTTKKIIELIKILEIETKKFELSLIEKIIKIYGKDPFLILICCLLSLRSRDTITIHVCNDLLKVAKTPREILDIPIEKLEKIIFKIGFYKNKSKVLHKVCREIINKHNEKVSTNLKGLLNLPGVGRKTANLVMGMAYSKPAICVDIHVHRISNRLGILKTKTPEETEFALQKILPKKFWIDWNNLLVKLGQNVCTPTSPKCSRCAIKRFCKRINIKNSR